MHRKGLIISQEPYALKCRSEKHPTFNYDLRLLFSPEAQLDQDGFIVDHNLIDQEIVNNVEVRSCELLADDIIDVVIRFMSRNNIPIWGLKLKILPVLPVPNEGAFFEQLWKADIYVSDEEWSLIASL